jgi:hypothetical protein
MRMNASTCSNCPRPLGPGGALGLCPRCYTFRRRHDKQLPPAESFRPGGMTEPLALRVDPELLKLVVERAAAEGLTLSAWVRRALARSLAE